MKTLTSARLHELFWYNPETGKVYRRTTIAKFKAGSEAGTICDTGHMHIGIDRRYYLLHRVIWMLMTGVWPEGMDVDHKNGIRHDNRWCNLRLATDKQNSQNMCLTSRSTSGLKGASFHKKTGKWCSVIRDNGRSIWLGLFPTAEAAHERYKAEAVARFGEFARFK